MAITEMEFMEIYSLIIQQGQLPIVSIDTAAGGVFVPRDFIEPDGTLLLCLAPDAVRHLKIENDIVSCRMSFRQQQVSVSFPLNAIIDIHAEAN